MTDKIRCEDLVPGYIYVSKKATKRALFIGHVSTINLTPLVLHPDFQNEEEEVVKAHLKTGYMCVQPKNLKAPIPRRLMNRVCVKQTDITYGMFFLDLDQMEWIFKGKNIDKKSLINCIQTNLDPRLSRQSYYFLPRSFNIREKSTFSKVAIDHKFDIPKNFIQTFSNSAIEKLKTSTCKETLEATSKDEYHLSDDVIGHLTYQTVNNACSRSKFVNMVYMGIPISMDPSLEFIRPYIVKSN